MFNKIYDTIKQFDKIIIHRHTKPDGDALGAQLGLKYALQATFPTKCIYAVGDELGRLEWMGQMDIIADSVYKDALVIVVDTGATHLISDERYRMGKLLIKIDHHIPQGEYGDLVYVDTSAESASGIIVEMIMKMKMVLSLESAEVLFTGIVTDSGRFRFNSVTSKTFDLVSFLLKANINTDKIYNNIYMEDLNTIRLRAKLALKFEITPTGIAYMIHKYDDVLSYGSNPFQISRGMVNIMGGIKGIYIWVNFTETEDGKVLVEFRSNGPNVNVVAMKYGGGGHLMASGTTIDSFVEIDMILADLEKVMEEYNGR